MRFSVILLTLAFSLSAFALEVDEKLTVRILKTSESRKTVMINRGTEDGLVEGDHARFIVTAGIVARAVCVKVAPTRSVWSVYRLVNADFIVTDSVMTIKITPPVKITKDESQALVQEDTPTKLPADPAAVGIPLAEGAQDLDQGSMMGDEKITEGDLRGLEDITIVEKNMEVFAFLNVSGLTSQSKSDVGDEKFSNSQSSHHIGIGGELYSRREREWYSRFTLIGAINFMRTNAQGYNGFAATNDFTEFTFGTNWHPGKMPSATYKFIPYVNLSMNLGSVRSTYSPGLGGNGEDQSANGSTSGFSLGFGYKYYTREGFGARAILDYYVRNEKFKRDENDNAFDRYAAGPRFMVGMSYRF